MPDHNRKVGEPREHRLVVESELRDPPDLRKLSRAVIELAKQSQDAEEDS